MFINLVSKGWGMDKKGVAGLGRFYTVLLIIIASLLLFFILSKIWSGIGSESLLPQ